MRALCLALWAGVSAFGLVQCGPGHEGSLSVPKLVVALKPDKNPEQMMEEQRKLEGFLSDALGEPVEVIIPLSDAVIEEGLLNGTVDLAYISGGTMLRIWQEGIANILLAGEIEGRTDYDSYWVSLSDSPYEGVESLRGQPVAFASVSSTSGYLVPHWDLVKRGLLEKGADPEDFFGVGNVFFGSGYVSAVERVLEGEAEAAAVSYYVLDRGKHLSEEQRQRLRAVAVQGPVPTHALAVRASLPEEDQAALRAALLRLNEEGNEALRDRVFTSKLVEVDPAAHLAPLREAFEFTGRQ